MIDLHQMIKDLRGELARVDAAIAQLDQLQNGASTPRVRSSRGRKFMPTEERKRVSERMRKYWAGRRQSSK